MKYFCLLLVALCFASCQSKTTDTTKNVATTPALETKEVTNSDTPAEKPVSPKKIDQTSKIATEEAMPLNGMFHRAYDMGAFKFNLFAENGENTTIKLESDKLSRAFNERYTFEGQVENGVVLDLDNDGFNELYLTCAITDDSGNKDIMGWASYRDKAAGQIYVDDTKMIRAVNSDKVFAKGGKLYRSFTDKSGATKTFAYTLSKGEAGMKLTPKLME